MILCRNCERFQKCRSQGIISTDYICGNFSRNEKPVYRVPVHLQIYLVIMAILVVSVFYLLLR